MYQGARFGWRKTGVSRAGKYRNARFEALEARRLLSISQLVLEHDGLTAISSLQTHLIRQDGSFLSGPASGDALNIATHFLASHAAELGLHPQDLADSEVANRVVSDHTGVTHLYLQQTLGGLEIANADLNVNIAPDGSVISVGSSFVSGLGGITPGIVTPSLNSVEAATALANTLGLPISTAPSVLEFNGGTEMATLLDFNSLSRDAVPMELQYVLTTNSELRLAWNAVARTPDGRHWLDASIDATTGELLRISDWVDHASYQVFAQPLENPDDGARTTVVDVHDPIASPFGWHDTDGVDGAEFTDTRGNNVFAQEDTDADDMNGFRPDGGPGLDFSFPLDLGSEPNAYQAAAITNLFYANNISHDISYQYGFTEAAGNFQLNNFGRGGLEGDPVLADAQDGAATDNAFMGTPPDGTSPFMLMGVFTLTTPQRDSDLSNTIIWHEYFHGISNRLTGGPDNSNALDALQSGGMGEGWSDWWGLMLTQKPTDGQLDAYPVGTYVLGQPTNGPGIRRFPYSFDMSINPLTYGDFNGGFPNNQVHNAGEIWASALWDLNWLLIDKLGFDPDLYNGIGGNNLTMQLVFDGLKLQPANPSFLDGRDGILMADQILTGGANQNEIWTAFARRGMGVSASDGGSGNSPVVIEAFDLPVVPPVAINDIATTPEDTPVAINVLANDFDPDGIVIPPSVTIVAPPANGTASVNPTTGQVTYIPAANFFGGDSLAYVVLDNDGLVSNPATVSITVTPLPDPPVAVDDVAATPENASVVIDVLANDFDPDGPGGPLTVQIVSPPQHGSTLIDFGTQRVMYSPDDNFSGADSFTYQVLDEDNSVSNIAQVSIRVGQPVGFSGRVFADADNNGAMSSDELGIPGVTVTVSKVDGPVVFSVPVVTGADGSFSLFEVFGGGFILPAGVYTITQHQPAEFLDGIDSPGSPPPAGITNDAFHNITLAAGQVAFGYQFGEQGLNAQFLAAHPEIGRFFASTVPGDLGDLIDSLFFSPGDAVGAVSAASFALRTSTSNIPAGLPTFNFGLPNWHPLSGDWNGDGIDTIGAYNSATATFFLTDSLGTGVASYPAFNYGLPGWIPLAGDWNGDGVDTIGVYNPATATFFLRNQNSTGVADVAAFNYGMPNWTPLAGDWQGQGLDTVGVFNPDTATYFLRQTNSSGTADIAPFNYGNPGWQPLMGDWNNDGVDSVGVVNTAGATFYLRNSNNAGGAEHVFYHGSPGAVVLAGHWMHVPGQPLRVDEDASSIASAGESITTHDVLPLLAEAAARWEAAGLDAGGFARLQDVQVHIVDLAGPRLGVAAGTHIYLDRDAAGRGWFVDLTPQDDEEFAVETAFGLLTDHDHAAGNHVDLLTVIAHELGHILGLADHDDDAAELMYEALRPAHRKLPTSAAVDALLSADAY